MTVRSFFGEWPKTRISPENFGIRLDLFQDDLRICIVHIDGYENDWKNTIKYSDELRKMNLDFFWMIKCCLEMVGKGSTLVWEKWSQNVRDIGGYIPNMSKQWRVDQTGLKPIKPTSWIWHAMWPPKDGMKFVKLWLLPAGGSSEAPCRVFIFTLLLVLVVTGWLLLHVTMGYQVHWGETTQIWAHTLCSYNPPGTLFQPIHGQGPKVCTLWGIPQPPARRWCTWRSVHIDGLTRPINCGHKSANGYGLGNWDTNAFEAIKQSILGLTDFDPYPSYIIIAF